MVWYGMVCMVVWLYGCMSGSMYGDGSCMESGISLVMVNKTTRRVTATM